MSKVNTAMTATMTATTTATSAASTGHTARLGPCDACDSTQWTNAQLSFKIDPFALTLVVHGPETLHIRCSLTEQELVEWNTRLMQRSKLNSPLLDVQIRSKPNTPGWIYFTDKVMIDRETCVLEDEAMFWIGVMTRGFAVTGDVLKLDHNGGTHEILVPRGSWPDPTVLVPSSGSNQVSSVLVQTVAPTVNPPILEGQVIQAPAGGDPTAMELSDEAQAARQRYISRLSSWQRRLGGLKCVDSNGFALAVAWQNGSPVFLQEGRYWVECTLMAWTDLNGLHLELLRNNGVFEHITLGENHSKACHLKSDSEQLVAGDLAGSAHNVLVKYVPLLDKIEGTHFEVDDNVLVLTYGYTEQLIELPATSRALIAALAALPGYTPYTLVHQTPALGDAWRTLGWNTMMILRYGAGPIIVVAIFFVLCVFALRLGVLALRLGIKWIASAEATPTKSDAGPLED